MSSFMLMCKHCPNGDFCRSKGCIAFNDEARRKYDRWRKAADRFDAAEADYLEPNGARRGDLPGWRQRR